MEPMYRIRKTKTSPLDEVYKIKGRQSINM